MHAPYDHPLDLATQAILTFGSWPITFILLGIAIYKGFKQQTWFFVLLILAVMVGALAEPLYDTGHMLLFYVPGQWTAFTAYGIPQPVWTFSGYAILYGAAALFICDQIGSSKMTPRLLFAWAGIELLMSMTFEIYGINGGTYTYWGPHVLRVFEYPLVIGILEAAQVITFSVAAARLRRHTQGALALLSLFVLFPCAFYAANFGAGAPVIIALHLNPPSPTAVWICTLVSIGFALVMIYTAAMVLPTARVVVASASQEVGLVAASMSNERAH